MSLKQRKIKFKPSIKWNHNIHTINSDLFIPFIHILLCVRHLNSFGLDLHTF